ncbi:MAG: spore coat protein [Oscillospiraceae bacterium]|nr:spore coat protein [Oscillospiraceae bacterium]
MTEATQGYLGDKEMLSDLLSTQKHVTNNYNTRAGECQCLNLRDTFLNILKEEHSIQSELFNESNSRGWYPVKEAPTAEITAAKQMFMQ